MSMLPWGILVTLSRQPSPGGSPGELELVPFTVIGARNRAYCLFSSNHNIL